MARSRHAIEDFQVANDAYIAGQVTVYEANPDGSASATKATLYADLSGASTLNNPQNLDSTGKWNQPVYVDLDVVCSVSAGAASGETGVVNYGGSARGTYVTATRYFTHDIITGPSGIVPSVEGNLYMSNTIFDSTVWATDVADLTLIINYQALVATVVPQATESQLGGGEIATAAEMIAGTAGKLADAAKVKTRIDAINPIGKHAVGILAASFQPDTTTSGGGPTRTATVTATNKVPYTTIDFDGSTQENAAATIFWPKSADDGTITFRYRWKPAGGSVGNGVVFGLSAIGFGNDDAVDDSYGTVVKVTDVILATTDIHISDESAAITVKNLAEGDMVSLLLTRFPGDAGDTLNGVDAGIVGIDVFLTTNAPTDA